MRKQIGELPVQVLHGDGGQAGNAVLHDLLVEHDLAVVERDSVLAAAGVDHHKGGGGAGELAEEAEVLAAGEGLVDELRLAAGSGDGLVDQVDHGGVVVLERVALLQIDLDVAVESDADALADAPDLLNGGVAAGVAEAAEDGHHPRFAGGDVDGVAAGHGAHGEDRGVHGVDAAGDHGLEDGDQVAGAGDGVTGGVGRRAVAAFAVDGDMEQVHRAGEVALIELHTAHGVILRGADVLTEDGVNMGVLHDPGCHQCPCAAGHQILARLEDQLDGAGELVAHMAQRLCGAQKHGGVQLYAFGIRRGFEVSEECTGCSGCCDADLGRAVRKSIASRHTGI